MQLAVVKLVSLADRLTDYRIMELLTAQCTYKLPMQWNVL